MAQIQFCGPSYTSQSPTADAERCLNLYPETIEGNGKSQIAMYPTPGLSFLKNLTFSQPVDALPIILGTATAQYRLFYICGTQFGELTLINGSWNQSFLGNFASNNTHKVFWAAGQGSIAMVVDGLLYAFVLGSGFSAIPPATFGGIATSVTQIAYIDGFFFASVATLVGLPATKIFASALLDPTTWPGTAVTQINVFPDGIISLVANQRQLWVLGQTASVVYYDSGNSPFPLDVVAGSYFESGCVAASTAQKLDNSIYWLDSDTRGQCIVRRANGYTPQRVSNFAVEFAMQSYSRVDDAFAYTYQDQGHSFYVLTFPSANNGNGATWSYDVATNSWHERCFLNGITEQAHRSRCYVSFVPYDQGALSFGKPIHLVGDSQATGNIYQMSIPVSNGAGGWNFVTDNGAPIKRLRRCPVVNIEQEWMRFDELSIDVETGLGPIPPLAGPSLSQPVAYLADSNGVIWAVTITDGGVLTRTSGGAGPAETIIINDSTSNTISWKLGITTGGVLTATSVAYLKIYPQTFAMATSGSLLQSGIQITSGGAISSVTPAAAARDPQIMLRFSKDNSHTWSNYFNLGAGQAGNYLKRVVHRRMGRARQMTFEVSCSEPIPVRFVNAYLRATAYGPEERLTRKLGKSA